MSRTGYSPSETAASAPASNICTLPERLHNTLLYRGSTFIEPKNSDAILATAGIRQEKLPSGGSNRYFPNGTEVLFKCLSAYSGKRRRGRLFVKMEFGLDVLIIVVSVPKKLKPLTMHTRIHPGPVDHNRNKSCLFVRPNPDVVAFVNDKKVKVDSAKFPAGTEVVYRCVDIGKYSFEGSARRRCVGGQWTGTEPFVPGGCPQEYDYALYSVLFPSNAVRPLPFPLVFLYSRKAPTILFRHQVGQIAQSNDGKLVVYPGTILHLECLWIRKYGTPHWEVSHKNRKYPEGWTNEPGRDSQLEYRLTIYHAKTEDSGMFTCVTPMGHQHAVEIVVSAVHCQTISETGGLILSTTVTKMNVKVVFSCEPGRKLIGNEQAMCLPSGQWSAKPPVCQKLPFFYRNSAVSVSRHQQKRHQFQCQVLLRDIETIIFGCKSGIQNPRPDCPAVHGWWSVVRHGPHVPPHQERLIQIYIKTVNILVCAHIEQKKTRHDYVEETVNRTRLSKRMIMAESI
ncbi:sushi, von Willebrand factor type A, EGF and pentraxin domain-containing protein 1 [Caerostris extrusa]|uniref:Sushi, von Willebrand factor type A, EGF and pentraxin domain-containing protein 1 n=1 Tax=Caerostris extrusa TaxID=172846 RepID=A0AAV4QSR4_CAEEX|nr:sushi, von Willebrand factor type A, EGF and pentraxin domain-containing protein 1 [Caerostris extrusa]